MYNTLGNMKDEAGPGYLEFKGKSNRDFETARQVSNSQYFGRTTPPKHENTSFLVNTRFCSIFNRKQRRLWISGLQPFKSKPL
jgi:hypothetical protein